MNLNHDASGGSGDEYPGWPQQNIMARSIAFPVPQQLAALPPQYYAEQRAQLQL
jgi:hypothetical protein